MNEEPTATTADPSGQGPLHGVRVVELATLLAGPSAAGMLAQLGADVIKVEPPWGDPSRLLVPAAMPDAVAPAFLTSNADKRSVAIDLKQPDATPIVEAIIQTADIVLDNFRPGASERVGIDKERALERRPELIWITISGYGPEGSSAGRPAVDQIIQAESGMMHTTGYRDGLPVKTGYQVVDHCAAHIAVQVALAALLERARTGRGRAATVSLFDAALSLQGTIMTNYLVTGAVPTRSGNQGPFSAPSDTVQTSDGMVMVAAYMDHHWLRLCEALERPDLLTDERFATRSSRFIHRDELSRAIEDTTLKMTAAEVEQLLASNGIMVGIVRDHEEVSSCEQVIANHSIVDVTDSEGARYRTLRQPVDLFGAPDRLRSLPAIGAHTEQVLREIGLSEEERRRLRGAKVVAWPGDAP